MSAELPSSTAVAGDAAVPTGPAAVPAGAAGGIRGALGTLRTGGLPDLLVAQVVPLGVTFVLTLVSAALLGPERRGVLTFLMTGALLAGALAYGSLHVPVVEALRVGDRSALRHGVRLVAGLAGALAVVGAVLVVTGRPGAADGGHSDAATTGWALMGGALIVCQLFANRVLQGLGRDRAYQVTIVVQSVLYLAGAGAVLATTRSPLLVYAAWALSVVAGLGVATTQLVRHLRDHVAQVPAGSPARSWPQFLRSATANNVGSIGQMVMLRADVLVVGVVLGPTAAGVYGIALSLTELVLIVPEAFALSVFSGRARLTGDRWAAQLARTVRLNAAVGLLAALCIAAAAVVLSLGPLSDYRGLVPLVLIVLPGALFAGYSRVALSALQALGRHSAVAVFGVLAVVLSAGYLPGAWLGGTAGTAAVSTAAYVVTALYLHTSLRSALRGGEAR
ncbi:lipopolysaccharide biosynthesis protein [Modestobacter sp. SSW1-42]|uniref:lipopolysaccharide biosynthesis protein n=1 Tax=Modestobacter sp. SSW1-42 TaxID=596372 RepID=UPI003985DE02